EPAPLHSFALPRPEAPDAVSTPGRRRSRWRYDARAPAPRGRPMRPPPLLLILGVLFLLGGLYIAARSLLRLLTTIRASRTFGAPYKRGQIADRFLGFLMALPLAPCGGFLLVLALGQAAFQPIAAGGPLK